MAPVDSNNASRSTGAAPWHTVLSGGLTAILSLALLDVTIETALTDTPVRGWVAGMSALSLALMLTLWPRLTWTTRALVSLVGLTASIIFSAYYPGGQTHGVILARQSTPVVLAIATACGIVTAIVVFARLSLLGVVGRLLACLFAAYCIAALLLGATQNAPYAQLIREGFWTALPFPLRGAFLGALIVTPAALIAHIATLFRGSSGWSAWAAQAVALAATIALGIAGLRGPAPDSLARAESVPAPASVATVPSPAEKASLEPFVEPTVPPPPASRPSVPQPPTFTAAAPPSQSPAPLAPTIGPTEAVAAAPADPTKLPVPQAQIELVVTAAVDEQYAPLSPANEFKEDATQIVVAARLSGVDSLDVPGEWELPSAYEGADKPERRPIRLRLRAGRWTALKLEAPKTGFAPGKYHLTLGGDSSLRGQSVSFHVIPLAPPAELLAASATLRGFNIATRALGGKLESFTSEYDGDDYAASHIIDGLASAWCSSGASKLPHEFVLSFHEGREAVVHAVVIDGRTKQVFEKPEQLPKHVEIWGATGPDTNDFTKITTARLAMSTVPQVIRFPPTRAKFLKIAIVSNYGNHYTQLDEISVLESAAGGDSILADVPKNLALAALGGAVARYTSADSAVSPLIDGNPGSSWVGARPRWFPQDVVLSFRGDQMATVDRVVLRSTTRNYPPYGSKTVSVSVSTTTPLDGFMEVGEITLPSPAEALSTTLAIGRPARFVRVRIMDGYESMLAGLSEIEIFESSEAGYESILMKGGDATTAATSDTSGDLPSGATEKEANDTLTEANDLTLGTAMGGRIDPLKELDFFKLSLPPSTLSLTIDLAGRPYVRTAMTLLDSSGQPLREFDPGSRPLERLNVSWKLPAGDYGLQVSDAPPAVVLIWDTSGSMVGRTEHLQRAVESYLDLVREDDRVQLIRFAEDVSVLLPDFTGDRERLKAAIVKQFDADGGTAVYSAIAKGIELLEPLRGNRAILVMTDGVNTRGHVTHPELWRRISEAGIRLYTIGVGTDLRYLAPELGSTGERFLAHIAEATNGRSLFSDRAEDLPRFYTQIAEELHAPVRYSLTATASSATGQVAVVPTGERIRMVSAPPQLELILDASGSMKRRLGKQSMMQVAKDAIAAVIQELPEDVNVALRVYGHRVREGKQGDCEDSQLVVPFGKINKGDLLRRVRGINALGTTPIAYSLRQAQADFGDRPGEKMIVLVTDGQEECGGNLAEAAATLAQSGFTARLNIVGFALADEQTKEELQRVADLTGGRFIDAADAKALPAAIEQSLAVPCDVRDAAATTVGSGLLGQTISGVPEGVFDVVVQAAGKPITIRDVRVAANRVTQVQLKKEGDDVGIRVLPPADASEVSPTPTKTSDVRRDAATPRKAGSQPAQKSAPRRKP